MNTQFNAGTPVELVGLGTAFEFHSPNPQVVRANVEGAQRYVTLAHDVGATGIKVRPNGIPETTSPARTIQQIGEALRECGEFDCRVFKGNRCQPEL